MKYDIAKLPMWARAHIAQLERERDSVRGELADYLNRQTPSNISFSLNIDDSRAFIQSDRVRLHLPDGWIDANVYNGKLKLMGRDSLVVHPCCSNVIEVAILK